MSAPEAGPECVVGLDIGGTKLAAGVVGRDGAVLSFSSRPTPARRAPLLADLLAVIDVAVADARGRHPGLRVVGAGVGCGGPLDRARGTVTPVNMPALVDEPVVEQVAAHLGVPTALENDATAAALGEQRHGAGRGAHDLVYLTVSTGIGGGVVADGRPLRGATGNAAELGHVVVQTDGRACVCGQSGCLEAYASGRSIAARAVEAMAAPGAAASVLSSSTTVTSADVAAAARAGDPVATSVWAQTAEMLGRGLALAVQVFDPEVVVLGGGVMQVGEQLLGPARLAAGTAAARCLFVLARLGPHVGVVGAGVVALDHLQALAADPAPGLPLPGSRSDPHPHTVPRSRP